jgi:bacterioferritin-associated ferredoxin
MYVCICRAVTDTQVRAAIEGGAQTREEVTAACCAGDDCGACHSVIEDMIEDSTGTHPSDVRRLRVIRAA